MRGVNKVIIIGNLGADPRLANSVMAVAWPTFRLPPQSSGLTSKAVKKREATEWHRISLFNRLGEIAAQYLRKGSKVYIEGSLRTRKYQDPNGQDRYITEIRAEQMQMLDGASGGSNDGGGFGGAQGSNQYQNQGGYGNQGGFCWSEPKPKRPNNFGQQGNNQQGGYNQGGAQGSNQNSFNNQNAPAQQNQFNKPAQTKPTAMPDGPVDDDIPFLGIRNSKNVD